MRHLRGLRVQILLWMILPLIVILVLVSFGSITLHQESMRDMVAERNAHVAGLVAARFDDQIRNREIALETILKTTVDPANLDSGLSRLEPLMPLFDLGIFMLDEKGALLASTPGKVFPAGQDASQILVSSRTDPDRAFYQLADLGSGSQVFFMARTDLISGRTVIGAISRDNMNRPDLLDHINRNPRREAYLIDSNGTVLYHHDENEIGRDYRIHAGVLPALRGEAGSDFEKLEDEDEHVVGYAPVLTTGWGLIIEEPWADVVVPGLQYSLWAPILVLIAAVASLSAVDFGLRRVIHPIQVLGREASRLAWGDFQAIEKPVGGIDEIHDLQSTLQEMAAQIHRYQDGMHDYIAVLTQTQEDERKRLARELHDVIVQNVIAMGQRVKILLLDWREDCGDCSNAGRNEVDQRLSKLSDMISQCLADVRNMIRDLRPIYLDELGLVSALETLSRSVEVADNQDVKIAFEAIGPETVLYCEANLAVYRIAQAAISNAVRHGKPEFVSMQLEFGEDGVVLTVEDNGIGFVTPERPSDLALEGHFGLVGMYERAIRLGGHLSICSQPGEGTTIVAFIPYALPNPSPGLVGHIAC